MKPDRVGKIGYVASPILDAPCTPLAEVGLLKDELITATVQPRDFAETTGMHHPGPAAPKATLR